METHLMWHYELQRYNVKQPLFSLELELMVFQNNTLNSKAAETKCAVAHLHTKVIITFI